MKRRAFIASMAAVAVPTPALAAVVLSLPEPESPPMTASEVKRRCGAAYVRMAHDFTAFGGCAFWVADDGQTVHWIPLAELRAA